MQRAAGNAWTICIRGAYRGFTTSLPSTSCYQRISRRSGPRTTAVPHRTVMSTTQWTCTPRVFPTSGFELLDRSNKLDEETLPTYQPEKYYPVNQGEDLIASTYVVLKVYVTGQARAHVRELRIYKQMNGVETKHPGRNFIRKLLDHFDIEGPHGRHVCLVHEPLGTSADFLVKMFRGHAMTLDDMKPGIRQLLIALDFLHSECHIIHTDLQLKNLLLPGPETSYLSRFEEAEVADPSPRKALKDRTIYKSLGFLPKGGLPILADFGEARLGDQEHNEDIMPNVYRALEVILRSNWGYKVDIWSVAMVAWDIVSSRTLINGRNPDGIFDDRVHMAELIALLGPPPPEFRKQRHLSSAFWDESGNWKEGKTKKGFCGGSGWPCSGTPRTDRRRWDSYDEWLMEGLGE
ncbi:hypothetical protein AFLA_006258 [Aspergillus flavus NRRL3357]|nr:hypothetical protein AFLA_006258 [Aspergillus flavus NRRL3357]